MQGLMYPNHTKTEQFQIILFYCILQSIKLDINWSWFCDGFE